MCLHEPVELVAEHSGERFLLNRGDPDAGVVVLDEDGLLGAGGAFGVSFGADEVAVDLAGKVLGVGHDEPGAALAAVDGWGAWLKARVAADEALKTAVPPRRDDQWMVTYVDEPRFGWDWDGLERGFLAPSMSSTANILPGCGRCCCTSCLQARSHSGAHRHS